MEALEKRLRTQVYQRRLRLNDYFHDFDRLRSGYVTKDQFSRVLATCQMRVSAQELDLLASVYDDRTVRPAGDPTKIHYTTFVAHMESAFYVPHLEKDPQRLPEDVSNLVESRYLEELSPRSEEELASLIARLRQETKTRGLHVKAAFQDFDKLRHGVVTRNQFISSLPFRVSEQEMQLLLKKLQTGSDVRYFELHEMLDPSYEKIASLQTKGPLVEGQPSGSHRSITDPQISQKKCESLVELLDLLKGMVLRHRIRVDEFFHDFDRLNTGSVSDCHFRMALGRVKFPRYIITERDFQLLEEYYGYMAEDGKRMVRWKEFLKELESVFTLPELEKNPLATFEQPLHLTTKSKPTLSEEEESALQVVLDYIKRQVRQRRILLKPLFQDFDMAIKGLYKTRHITRERFRRALATANIRLSDEQCKALWAKYDDDGDGQVNYEWFLEDVDQIYEESRLAASQSQSQQHNVYTRNLPWRGPESTSEMSEEEVDEVENRLRECLFGRRTRLVEFFQQFDRLHSGVITKNQFRQVLDMGSVRVSEREFQGLVSRYHSDRIPNGVSWVQFNDSLESVFTGKGLEKNPLANIPDGRQLVEQRIMSRTQPKRVSRAPEETVQAILSRVRKNVESRNINLKPTFLDFDRLRKGFIPKSRWGQAQGILRLGLEGDEWEILFERYKHPETDDFCYTKFLEEIDPPPSQVNEKFGGRLPTFKEQGLYGPGETDLSRLITRIKSQVARERIYLKGFLEDHDPLRHGNITAVKFTSALQMAGIPLTAREQDLLVDSFRFSTDSSDLPRVAYLEFLDELDSVFTVKNLEKTPTRSVEQFVPRPQRALLTQDRGMGALDEEEREALKFVLPKLIGFVESHRLLAKPFFQDFDRVRVGRVTKSQFQSCCNSLKLPLTHTELEAVTQAFTDEQGDIDYVSFCQELQM